MPTLLNLQITYPSNAVVMINGPLSSAAAALVEELVTQIRVDEQAKATP